MYRSNDKRSGSYPWLPAVSACLLLVAGTRAGSAQDSEDGVKSGNYTIKQSIEIGQRFANTAGDVPTYDTFVNLQDGTRLLGLSTEMNSIDHRGIFDRLSFVNSGYGGDPNEFSRLSVQKNKWYDLDASYRHDNNYFNYSLLANPLNPTTPAFANAPSGFNPVIGVSPQSLNTRRILGDVSLTLFPQSKFRVRVGYSHNSNEGPGFTTIHQGTEQLLLQDIQDTVNSYRIGLDYKGLTRTNISYDQILSYYDSDTTQTDDNQLFKLKGGTPVDLGVSFNAGANQPCGGTFQPGAFVNPSCSGYLSYLRQGHVRTTSPTEQVSIQSNYFQDWDLSAKASYTGGNLTVDNWSESLAGLESRTGLRNQLNTGPVVGRHVAANADFGATWHITDRWSFLDSFHFSNWHNPVGFDGSSCSFFGPNLLATPNVFSSSAASPIGGPCTPPAGAVAGIPIHGGSSAPDVSLSIANLFLKQEEVTNLSEIQYQFSAAAGIRGGFRYRHRSIDASTTTSVDELFFPNNANRGDCALVKGGLPAGCTANGDGSFTFVSPSATSLAEETLINESSGLFGFWAKPARGLKLSFDTEIMSADNAFTRISPRQTQEYRLRATYAPAEWVNLAASVTLWEGRNNVVEVDNLQHNRTYALTATFQASDKLALELGYDYNDVFSQILICYTSSAVSTGPSTVACTGVPGLVQQLSVYTSKSSYGQFDLSYTPSKRLTVRVGGNFSGATGSVLIISPNAPSGPLNSTYFQPFGGIDYHFAKRWTGKGYWAYYRYREDLSNVVQDTVAPRNFSANVVTVSFRYGF